jgi:invasion protein IalB
MDIRAQVLDIASIYMAQLGLKYNFAGQQRSPMRTWGVRIAAVLGGVVGLILLLSLWLPDGPDSDAQAQQQQQQNRQQQTVPVRPAQPAQGQRPAQPAGPTVRNFDDWALVCDKPQGATRDLCFVYQQIQVNNTSNTNQRLLLTRVGQASAEGVSMLAFTLPLGSRLQSGMALKVDDNPQIQAAFQVCVSDGCLAGHPLDADLLQQMSSGKQAVVAVIDHGNGQQINITVSLKGFGAAYKALPNPPALAARPAAAAAPAPAAQAPPPARGAAPAANQPAARQPPAAAGQAPQLQPPGTQRR